MDSAALQLALDPLLLPMHDHVHGPSPDTALEVPAEHRFKVGVLSKTLPLAEPQLPFTIKPKFAVTVLASDMVTSHKAVPLQLTPQPRN